jgi:hypothetical protein
MKIKHILAAAAIATVGIANSYAANYDLGLLPSDSSSLNYGGGWQAQPAAVAPGSFTDMFTFSLNNILSLNASANIVIPGGFYSLAVTPVSQGVTLAGVTNYSFSVTGVASSQYGVYTVDFSGHNAPVIPPAPVPEPETFAMLLAGLGLIGAIVRRRNKGNVPLAA